MNYIDFIILLFVAIGFILGFKDGLIRKLIGLAGIIAAIYFAAKFYWMFGEFISDNFEMENYFAKIVAVVIIFLLVNIAASLLKRIVHPHDKINLFANQILGGIAGSLHILFFLSAFFMLTAIFNFPSSKTAHNSWLYKSVYNLIPNTINVFIGKPKNPSELLNDYIYQKDSTEVKKK